MGCARKWHSRLKKVSGKFQKNLIGKIKTQKIMKKSSKFSNEILIKKLNKTVEGTQQKRTVSLAEAVSRQGMN